MKGKKTSYFMLPIVLAIWGVIGWKVYAAFGKSENAPAAKISVSEKIKETQLPDTVKLIANYRDPFLDKAVEHVSPKSQGQKQNAKVVVKPPVVAVPVANWPKVVYHGLVKKSSDKKTVGFLSVDGKSAFVQSGEEAGAVKVGRIWKDSVEVLWGKEKKICRK